MRGSPFRAYLPSMSERRQPGDASPRGTMAQSHHGDVAVVILACAAGLLAIGGTVVVLLWP